MIPTVGKLYKVNSEMLKAMEWFVFDVVDKDFKKLTKETIEITVTIKDEDEILLCVANTVLIKSRYHREILGAVFLFKNKLVFLRTADHDLIVPAEEEY